MEGPIIYKDSKGARALPLHTVQPLRRTAYNRVFAAIYFCAILALLYRHAKSLLSSTTLAYLFINLAMLISDLVLAFEWTNTQALRMCPVSRKEFPENLQEVMERSDFPALDVFICTADPYKEPPMGVVNTAMSVMAYDYPTEKLSVYVSDDGGSALTLFALREGAKFARHWLAFCRKNSVVERSPEAYFDSDHPWSSETEKIKAMYESMNLKVKRVLERGKVDEFITEEQERKVFGKWTSDNKFTRQDHPTIIQVLLDAKEDKDVAGDSLPNFIYVSREKCKSTPHRFKAGALNVLLRVSAIMTNAPIMLTLDCDMFSNDPETPLRAICYLCDPALRSKVAYVQFPQRFRGINRNDTYAGQCKRLFQIHPIGSDGLQGPIHVGTGCFFSRRAFFGSPSSTVAPEIPELAPDHVVDKPIQSQSTLALAHQVASCNYENQTQWGNKVGYRYGSLVEDYYTGYLLQCEGWRSIFCDPERFAFLGDAPISLSDVLSQQKRWCVGLLEAGICKHSPLTLGFKTLAPLAALGFAHHVFWALWSIPITTYAFLPQLALVNQVYIFPEASDPWFLVYMFLFLGAYAQDLLEYVMSIGTFRAWWNDQRFWLIRGLSCYLYGLMEFSLKALDISGFGFSLTSKVVDDELRRRYDQGIFEFGVHTPLFVPLTMAAIINLVSFAKGLALVSKGPYLLGSVFVQLFLAGFGMVNSWPIYEAIFLRSDRGKLPLKTTAVSVLLSSALYAVSSSIFK